MHDLHKGTTSRISIDGSASQATGNSHVSSISGDGRYVVGSDERPTWSGDTNRKRDAFVHDRHTGTAGRVSVDSFGNQGNDRALGNADLSVDGRYVAFASFASNLVLNDTSGTGGVFVRYTTVPTVEHVSPTTAVVGSSLRLIITGSGFHENATVALGAGITVTSVEVLDETRIRADITVEAGNTLGARHVLVTNLGSFGPLSGTTNICPNCLTVT